MNGTAGVGFTRVDYNTTLFKPPEELRLRIDTIDKPTDADLIVKGKRLQDEDELRYGPLQQDEYLRATFTFCERGPTDRQPVPPHYWRR